jgi:hypothetical protein
MNKTFLEYYKEILDKVSFDSKLLSKEYQKALNLLEKDEEYLLRQWIREKGFDISMSPVKNQSKSGPFKTNL